MSGGVRGSRSVVVLLVPTLGALAIGAVGLTGLTTACSSSSSGAVPSTDASVEGSLVYTTVTTGGGGVPAADAAVTDPFPGSSGSSSGGGSGSSGGEGGIDSGSSSGAGDGGDDGSIEFSDAPYTPPSCNGTDPCDLRSNTCCLASGMSNGVPVLLGTCTPGRTSRCSNTQATVHCLQALDCPLSTGSCCGDILVQLGQVEAICKDIPDGGSCPYVPPTVSQIGVQLCKTDAECKNGQPCVHQACAYGAVLDMCGLQSGMPLNCTPM